MVANGKRCGVCGSVKTHVGYTSHHKLDVWACARCDSLPVKVKR